MRSTFTAVFTLAVSLLLASPASAQVVETPLGECRLRGEVTNTGPSEVNPDKSGFYLVDVHIICDDAEVFADEVRWTAERFIAIGHVLLEQRGLRITASRIELDRATRLGTFYDVRGWARIGDPSAEPNPFGALEPDVQFEAERVDRLGPRTYRLSKGWYSSCAQPVPRWAITHTSGTIVVDEHVIAKNAVMRVKGVPVFYVPWIYYPLGQDDRSTGFLMPQYTATTAQGSAISNAFFWAINRSQDMTLYHTWFSKAGQSVAAEYRYAAAPGSTGQAQFTMLDNVNDDSLRRYIVKGTVNQRVGRRMYVIGRVNYTTDQLTQQLFQQNLYDLSHRERYAGGTLTGNFGRYRLMAAGELRDIYDAGFDTPQRQGLTPAVSLSIGEKAIGGTPIYFGMGNDAVSFVRKGEYNNPDPDRSLFRFDTTPTIRAPISRLPFLRASASASLRFTYWSKSQYDSTPDVERPVGGALTRNLVDLRMDVVGPVFEKVWTSTGGYADRFKHVIEPRARVAWLSAFDRRDEVVQIDWVDTMVGGTTTVTYELVNRILARRVAPGGGRGTAREILAVTVSQSYYTDALAAAYDSQYQSVTPNPYSPVQITATAAPADGLTARFQMYVDSEVLRPLSYSAAAAINGARTQLGIGWSKRQYLPDVPGYNTPEGASHYLNWTFSTRSSGGRVGANYLANLDLRQGTLLQQRMQLTLNAQCCGVTLDYQILQAGQVGLQTLPADRRFGISFSLAGLGSFSNPFGSFGDNSGRR